MMETNATNEELLFAEKINELMPLISTLSDILKGSRLSLKNQQYRMDGNHRLIVSQEKQIAQNQAVINDAKDTATKIIAVAQDRAKEIDKGVNARVAEANHMEREAKKKLDEAEKKLWDVKNKKPVEA